jgi:pimeloyl-ACP methyl ester carboxylesterase
MNSKSVRELKAVPSPAPGVQKDSPPRGRIQLRILAADTRLRSYLYWPASATREAPVLVAVHGISRNAREQARLLAAAAERYGVVIVAPLFGTDFFPDFQRLGRRGLRADHALNRMLEDLARGTGLATGCVSLYGFSGGGQFCHRYAMAYPERVAGLVVTAAGWYTWPDEGRAFPQGMGRSAQLPDLRFDLERFLQIPTSVLVGTSDILRDVNLRQTPGVDRRQGTNRLERGRRWVRRLQREAGKRGIDTRYEFRLLEHSGHDFAECIQRDRMDEQIFQLLFDAGRAPPPA